MKINYDSVYKEYANQTIDWISGDTEDAYNTNLTTRKSLLEKYDWINNRVNYTFNSHGFRCSEFTDEPSILFLGCSYTLGLGLNQEQTWTQIVADSLKLKSINLGQAGGSIDTAFRLGSHWIEKLMPKIVVLLTPSAHRFELIEKDMIHFLTPHRVHKDRFSPYHEAWLSDQTNSTMSVQKNTLALEFICLKNNIKFVEFDATNLKHSDFARDLAHPGIKSHNALASKILAFPLGLEPNFPA